MTASHDVPNETMMAWRVHAFGPPEAMSFEPVPRPEPGPGEVLDAMGGRWRDGTIVVGSNADGASHATAARRFESVSHAPGAR